MKRFAILLIFFVVFSPNIFAEGLLHRVVTNDGSTIIGKLVEMKDGVYVFETKTFGKVEVEANSIIQLSTVSESPVIETKTLHQPFKGQKSPVPTPEQFETSFQKHHAESAVQSMLADEDYLEQILNLSENSTINSILSDPEIMEAISTGNYDFLMNNPKIIELMNSSEIQNLLGEMGY